VNAAETEVIAGMVKIDLKSSEINSCFLYVLYYVCVWVQA